MPVFWNNTCKPSYRKRASTGPVAVGGPDSSPPTAGRDRWQVAEHRGDLTTGGHTNDRSRVVEAAGLGAVGAAEAGATPSPESATSKLPSGATVIFFGWLSPLAITWTCPTGPGWAWNNPW